MDSKYDPPPFPAKGFVRLKQIIAPLGPIPIGISSYWKWVKDGKAPQPLKIGPNTTVWRAEEINALLERLGEAQPVEEVE